MSQRIAKIGLRCLFFKQVILFPGIVSISDGKILSVMIDVFNFVYFFDILVFKHQGVQNNVIINLGVVDVVCCVFFKHFKLSQIVFDHFQIFLWCSKVVAFGLNHQID